MVHVWELAAHFTFGDRLSKKETLTSIEYLWALHQNRILARLPVKMEIDCLYIDLGKQTLEHNFSGYVVKGLKLLT